MTVIKKDADGNKTRFCEVCKTRHALDHEHFKGQGDKAANTVTASKSGADLADQAGRGKLPAASHVTLQRMEQEKLQEQREALERRWGRRMRMVYGFASKLLDDPKIKLSDEETRDMGETHGDLCMAFGWTASGKIEAIADVSMIHMTCIAARSEWGRELLDKLVGKKSDEEKRAAEAEARP